MNDLLLVAHIAGERVAFRAADIQSVVELGTITPVPHAPAFVAGLAALRSRPLTVIDSFASLGLVRDADAPRTTTKAVVVERDRHLYALLVDGIEDVIASVAEVTALPGELAAGWQRASLGLIETAMGALLLADPAALIAGPELRNAA